MPDQDYFANALRDDRSAAALLAWYVASGADLAMGDLPLDRMVAAAVPPAPFLPRDGGLPRDGARVLRPAAESAEAAESLARAAKTLEELESAIREFEGCALKKTAMNTVFADGNPKSGLMILGLGPGSDEDRQGKPFAGLSGQLLDRMLQAIGRDRMSDAHGAYLANILPWRPPGNRKPTAQEMAVCLPFVRRHIALARPRLLVFLGGPVASALLGITEGIARVRGRWLDYADAESDLQVPVITSYHPDHLLLQPAFKADAWRDLQNIQARLLAMGAPS